MTTMKRFDEKFGTDGPERDSDSIGRKAGCDDCETSIEIRGEHKSFFKSELSAAIAKVEGKKVDVRPEIRVWLTGNRKTNESYNVGLSDAITTFREEMGI